MLSQNKAEFDKLNITYWRSRGHTGKDTTAVVLDVSGQPLKEHNVIEPLRVKGKDERIGHKTHVCGIIREIVPDATIYAFHWSSDYKDKIIAWIKAHRHEIDVINCSFEGVGSSYEMLKELKSLGIPITGAMGNDSKPRGNNTSSLDFVIGIGAWQEYNDKMASYSNYGLYLDFVTYSHIYYLLKGRAFMFSGTSCAAPVAAALICMAGETHRRVNGRPRTAMEAFEFMLKNVDDKETPGRDDSSGYGLFRLPATIEEVKLEPEIEGGMKVGNNLDLVEFAKQALEEDWGYCLGAFGNKLTPAFLSQKLRQGGGVGTYNSRHRAYLSRFINKRVSDCYGLVKAFVWWNNGNVKYIANQDRNQEGAFNAAKEKGPIASIPEIPGLVLWMKGHAGIYIGNGEFIECVGAPIGMRKGKIVNGRVTSGSKFTHWFKDTYVTYIDKAPSNKLSIRINGVERFIDGFIKSGVSYADIDGVEVPLRSLGEGLGFRVGWDPHNKVVLWND